MGGLQAGDNCVWDGGEGGSGLTRPRRRAAALGFLAEQGVERVDHPAHAAVGEAVVDRLALAAVVHKALEPEPRQLLRHCRLPLRQQTFEVGNRPFTRREVAQDHQPPLMGERLQELARGAGAFRHGLAVGIADRLVKL